MNHLADLVELNAPWWTFVLRAAIVYFFVLIIVRASGKRTIGEFTAFDMIVMLLLAEAMQSALVPEEKSILASAIAAVTLVGLNWLVGYASARSRVVDKIVEGEPVVLLRNGRLLHDVLRRENLPETDVREAMRRYELSNLKDVKLATLETDGEITIVPYPAKK